MRVALYHLADDPLRHRVQGQSSGIRTDLSDQQEHKDCVAEFPLKSVFTRVVLHGVEQLVHFFEQVGSHALKGLRLVPGTPLWTSQAGDDLDEFEKRWAILAHGWLQSGRKGL